MTIKEKIKQVVVALGLTGKTSMTNADWQKIAKSYKETFGVELEADINAAKVETPADGVISPELQARAEALIAEDAEDASEEHSVAQSVAGASGAAPAAPGNDVTAIVEGLVSKVEDQTKIIRELARSQESGAATQTAQINRSAMQLRVLGMAPHTPKNLFGIDDPFFARGKWWNEITMTRKQVDVKDVNNAEKQSFMEAFTNYMDGFKNRVAHLSENNMLASLDYQKMIAGESNIDYSELFNTAGEYIIRRQDLILAYLRSLPSVQAIFPLVSNIQNKEVAPGANFGELSQGYRSGKVFKGNVAFTAEIYSVTDVMFKFKFTDMIKLEKQYIGYLNREGSSTVKWGFIEWIIAHFGQILFNEQQRRRVAGVNVPRQNVVSNPAIFGADGALRAIERVEEELKVAPFEDLKVYTDVTILEYLESFYAKVESILPNMDGIKLYVNAKHRRWYLALFRAKYGKDNDFTANKDQLIDVLVPSNISWVPNMDNNCYKVWMTIPGNVENYEDKPAEMTQFYFERDFEDVLVMSRWKEGSGLQQAGVKYSTAALLAATNHADQWIFTNYPVTVVPADATTIDGSVNNVFLTTDNTAAKALTNITNASIEKVYKIISSGGANPTSIAAEGKFAKIASAWTPKAKGDYIKLYAELEDYTVTVGDEIVTKTRATGNFLELERKVTA